MIKKAIFTGSLDVIQATIGNLRANDIPFCTHSGFDQNGQFIGKGSRYLDIAWQKKEPRPQGWSPEWLVVTIRERDQELVILSSCATVKITDIQSNKAY